MSNNTTYYHNKGEQDAESRNYAPPHGFLDELTMNGEQRIEENAAYDQGYFHTRGQIDYGDSDYNPPSNFDCKEAYDEGWEAAKNS